jgi:hypothetical protein
VADEHAVGAQERTQVVEQLVGLRVGEASVLHGRGGHVRMGSHPGLTRGGHDRWDTLDEL